MPVYKKPEGFMFTRKTPVEMHFHDEDEIWVIQEGSCIATMIGSDGQESRFTLESGDIWMVEAGLQHGCIPDEGGCKIFPFFGTIPEGSHNPGHYYLEKEKYIPRLYVKKMTIKES